MSNLILMRRTAGGAPQTGGGAYEYLRPVYTLPTGMSYNATTGFVDGTVMNTAYSAPATEVLLTDQGSRSANATALTNAITTAASSGTGTRIRLPANVDYGGSYTLPVNNSSGWIYVEAAAVKTGGLPEGTRVTAANASVMPKMYATGINVPVFTLPAGNNKYRFVGLEFAMAPSGVSWAGENAGGGVFNVNPYILHSTESATSTEYCNNVIIDRCYLHGDASLGLACKRLLLINGANIAIIDSSLQDVLGRSLGDGQCLSVTAGPGPYKIVNNYMTQACDGEHITFGGGNAYITPADIEVQRNHFTVPLSWYATGYREPKNWYEMKVGFRTLVQGNVFENYRASTLHSQFYPINIKTVDQNNVAPASGVRDFTMRLNEWRNCSSWLLFGRRPENTGTAMNRAEATCNRMLKPTSDWTGVIRVYSAQIEAAIDNVRIRHNSVARVAQDGAFVISSPLASAGSMSNHQYTDNFWVYTDTNATLWWRNGDFLSSSGLTGWNDVSSNSTLGTYSGNALTQSSSVPTGNTTVATEAAADFVSATLALNSTSPLKGTATSGRDPGVVHGLVNMAIAGVA